VSAARDLDVLPPEWREHYADLAADWVREKGTLPPSLEVLAEWAAAPREVDADAYLRWLETGEGESPWPDKS
jgi:hypothetical protein